MPYPLKFENPEQMANAISALKGACKLVTHAELSPNDGY